jgi:hypothetical protein
MTIWRRNLSIVWLIILCVLAVAVSNEVARLILIIAIALTGIYVGMEINDDGDVFDQERDA